MAVEGFLRISYCSDHLGILGPGAATYHRSAPPKRSPFQRSLVPLQPSRSYVPAVRHAAVNHNSTAIPGLSAAALADRVPLYCALVARGSRGPVQTWKEHRMKLQQVPSKLNLVFLDAPDSASLPTCSSRGSNSSSWVSVFNNSPQCWPTALLPTQLPAVSISILSCHLSLAELRSSKQRGRAVAASLGRAVQQSLQQDCHQQLVLIGHGFGGHLLKEACLQLLSGAANPNLPACNRQQYACTLHSIRALVFYSTPHQPLPRLALPEYEYVLPDMAAVCHKFRALAQQQQWQTLGVGAAVQGDPSQSVPLAAAAKGMSAFVAVPADQATVSKPSSSSHPSFVALATFLQGLRQQETKEAGGLLLESADALSVPCSSPPARLGLLQRLLPAVVLAA